MQLTVNTSKVPLGPLVVIKHLELKIPIVWDSKTSLLTDSNQTFTSEPFIFRYLCRFDSEKQIFGANPLQRCEVDHWISFSLGPLSCDKKFTESLTYLDTTLASSTYLVGNNLTAADLAVWSKIVSNKKWNCPVDDDEIPRNLYRWFSLIGNTQCVKETLESLPNEAMLTENDSTGVRKDEGKYVELPGAEMGKVVVRFPPEASGYLHIGHAKAALLNQYYRDAFKGKLIMRFDDTNPAKEKVDFEKVILEDMSLLKIEYDKFSHTSDYFDIMLEMCERLLKNGKAYVDDTDPEVMKNEREQKLDSKNRNNKVEENLRLWQEMKNGTALGQKCCVRAKINMQSLNGCMRDPTIYRCKNEAHPKTGTKYKVYPTYDFACPIVDSIEGVTHSLRTMEYHDRDEQFYWFIDVLELRKPYIWEYSRLNMTNTVLSKRKLTWFVESGYVDGWDDPRMPTVRGVLRRGMTVEGLKQFITAQGSSRSVVVMEWDKIWAFNKKVIDPIAPRFTAVDADNKVPLLIKGVKEEEIKAMKHPKNPEVGEKTVWLAPKIWIDEADARVVKEGENVTLINWGNVKIVSVKKKNNVIEEIIAEPNFEDKNYKKTLKLTWLADTPKAKCIECICVYFDFLISKPILGKDEDFKSYINPTSKIEVRMIGDPELASLKKSEIIQLQRKGFFICDEPYRPPSIHTGRESPVVLLFIPDGHTKELPTSLPSALKTSTQVTQASTENKNTSQDSASLDKDIREQGDKIRQLKQSKADKGIITAEVNKLLKLKEAFKTASGQDWKPDIVASDIKVSSKESQDEKKLSSDITEIGNKIRSLKQSKAKKELIDENVKNLLALKAKYKELFGKDWVPTPLKPAEKNQTDLSAKPSNNAELSNKIKEQGDKVRQLKSSKAAKNEVDKEVSVLLELKSKFKCLTGQDWKPEIEKTLEKGGSSSDQVYQIELNIKEQGDKIRNLKQSKSPKNIIDAEVAVLLKLKADFKALTGIDWKPGQDNSKCNVPKENVTKQQSTPIVIDSNKSESIAAELESKIKEQGDIVRTLKSSNAPKESINEAVQKLLALKSDYKNITGKEYVAEGQNQNKKSKQKKDKPDQPVQKDQKKKEKVSPDKESNVKKVTRLGIEARKEENLPDWYSQVIVKGELIEYYDVSGCYILRPWSFAIWEVIKDFLDHEIKLLGVKNCYFPIFVSRSVLEKEKSHIADFAPEVAWVTKSGESDLAEPIAIRPTSETVMYPAFAKWIQSYRDLPIKMNQWNNVVRWEFKHPQPFLRTREFLWQEGHTAYASLPEAEEEVRYILDLYARVYNELLAIPVIKGRKTEKEKFAGGDYTLTVEGYISASGRAIQGATSHHLGQNFSKMFEIIYEDPETQEKKYVYQNSWGLTTRTIGVMIMVHADNQGLVLPPQVASLQVIIVPCGLTVNLSENEKEKLLKMCKNFELELKESGVKVEGDYRDNYSPGWKFNHWELKGVPIRIEIGPKDVQAGQVVAVRRDTGAKLTIPSNSLVVGVKSLLDDIQANLLKKATEELESHKVISKDWDDFCKQLDNKCIILSPFCGGIKCEEEIKEGSARTDAEVDSGAPSMGAKSLCIPLEQPKPGISLSDRCINPACQEKPKFYTLFGRSY